MRRSRFARRTDWDGNIARMNALIDDDMRRWSTAQQRARETFDGELASLYRIVNAETTLDTDKAAAWARIRYIVGV